MSDYTKYQQKAIKNYYDNRETVALQRVQELVTELYLSEGKKREKHWKDIAGHLAALGLKQAQIDHLVKQNDPAVIAKMIPELMQKVK